MNKTIINNNSDDTTTIHIRAGPAGSRTWLNRRRGRGRTRVRCGQRRTTVKTRSHKNVGRYSRSKCCSTWTSGRRCSVAAGGSVCSPCARPTRDTTARSCLRRRTCLEKITRRGETTDTSTMVLLCWVVRRRRPVVGKPRFSPGVFFLIIKNPKNKQTKQIGNENSRRPHRCGSDRCCPISGRWTFAGLLCAASTWATSPPTCFAIRRIPTRTCTGLRWAPALEHKTTRGKSIPKTLFYRAAPSERQWRRLGLLRRSGQIRSHTTYWSYP